MQIKEKLLVHLQIDISLVYLQKYVIFKEIDMTHIFVLGIFLDT